MLKRARKLPLSLKIIYTVILSIGVIAILSVFNIDLRVLWIIGTFATAAVANIFFPMKRK